MFCLLKLRVPLVQLYLSPRHLARLTGGRAKSGIRKRKANQHTKLLAIRLLSTHPAVLIPMSAVHVGKRRPRAASVYTVSDSSNDEEQPYVVQRNKKRKSSHRFFAPYFTFDFPIPRTEGIMITPAIPHTHEPAHPDSSGSCNPSSLTSIDSSSSTPEPPTPPMVSNSFSPRASHADNQITQTLPQHLPPPVSGDVHEDSPSAQPSTDIPVPVSILSGLSRATEDVRRQNEGLEILLTALSGQITNLDQHQRAPVGELAEQKGTANACHCRAKHEPRRPDATPEIPCWTVQCSLERLWIRTLVAFSYLFTVAILAVFLCFLKLI